MKKKENRNLFILLLDFIQCNLLFTWSRWRKTVLSLYSSKQIIIYSFFNRSAICYMNVIERERDIRWHRYFYFLVYFKVHVYVCWFLSNLLLLIISSIQFRTARDTNFMYAHHTTDKSTFEKILICVHLKIYFFLNLKNFPQFYFAQQKRKSWMQSTS